MHLGQFADAWRSMNEALTTIETSKERLFDPEVNRMAGEISLLAPDPDFGEAESHLARFLATARAKRKIVGIMCSNQPDPALARPRRARESHEAPLAGLWLVYGRVCTRDLQEAKLLLDELQ